MEGSAPIIRDPSWVQCIVIPLASCFGFAQVMAFWGSTSKWGTRTSKNNIVSAVKTARYQWVSFASCRTRTIEKSLPRAWYQDFYWPQEGSWGQVRLIIATFCWWAAWLEQVVKVLLSVDLWYQSSGCHVSQVSFNTWCYSWRIRRHRTSELTVRTDTTTSPVS